MSAGIPHSRLFAILLFVLLLHFALLKAIPASFSFDEPLQTRPFLTRSIAAAAPLPAAPVVAAVPARPGAQEPTRPVAKPAPVVATKRENSIALQPAAASSAPGSSAVQTKPEVQTTASPEAAVQATPAPSAPAAVVAETATPAHPIEKTAATAAAAGAAVVLTPAPPAATTAPAAPSGEAPAQRPTAAMAPPSATLKYKVLGEYRGLPQNASAELVWRQDGRSYEARLSIGILFRTRVQNSRGNLGPAGLLPTRFSDKVGSERAAHFERAASGSGGQIIFSANSPPVALAAGAQDRLSVLLQLGALLAGEPTRHPVGSSISMQVVGAREADLWTFKIEGEEAVDIPYGQVQSMKLTRSPRREYDQKVEVWLATTMGYLPARVRVTEHNGNILDQQLSTMETP